MTTETATQSAPRWISRMFAVNVFMNLAVSLPSMIAPRQIARRFGSPEPEPAFPTQAWAGMAVMFAFMFHAIAKDPVGKRALVRYAWVEKLVSAIAITVGFRRGEAPRSAFLTITAVDTAMVLPFLLAELRLASVACDTA